MSVALIVGVTWLIGATLPVGAYLGGEPTLLDVVTTWVFSAMLLTLGAAAWLIAEQADARGLPIAIGLAIVIAAVAGATGNVLEDGFRIPGAELLYGLGLFGLLIGYVGLTIALAARRRWFPASLSAGTLTCLVVAMGHGPPLLAILWLLIAAWAAVDAWRDRRSRVGNRPVSGVEP